MASWVASSGDLIVDRRHAFAEGFAADGDLGAAIEILADAMALAPGWTAGWFRLGEWHQAAGDSAAAVAAWDKALAADPSDRLGAGLKRDLARAAPEAAVMPPAFVEALFDQYAAKFDVALVEKLGYRAPGLLAEALNGRHFARAMDLGCGTGLAGAAFRTRCDWLAGCDISAAMLAQAEAKGLYDRLDKRDLGALVVGVERFDLILAADVFLYLGALDRILGWCAASLLPGGVLGFTVESSDTAPLILRESRRFAHSRDYLAGVLQSAGFGRVQVTAAVLRRDRGQDIAGLVVLAEAPGPPVAG